MADPDAVQAGAAGVRPVLAERRDPDPHESRVEIRRRDVPPLEGARSEILDDDVGGRGEGPEHGLTVRDAEIDGHAPATATLDRPEQRVALVGERSDVAHEVAAARLLDLDHVGALFAEQPGAERCRDACAQVEDPESLEWSGHVTRSRPGGPGRSGPARRARRAPVGVCASLMSPALGPEGRAARAPLGGRGARQLVSAPRSCHPLSARRAGPLGPRSAGAARASWCLRLAHVTRSRPGGPGRSGPARRARRAPVGVCASLMVYADSPACSALTASIPPALRASVRSSASAELLTNW